MKDAADAALAAQYDAYPYPQRDPRDEAKRLIIGSPSHLREVDHWIFGARRPASQPLRALVAGGGSGDATVMLAQQMTNAGRAGDVTWLDRSAAARGGLLSGGALKAAQRYGQDYASTEFGNAYNRLAGRAGFGQTASTNMGTAAGNYGVNAGNNMMAGANARASGYVGGANALTGGLNQYLNYTQGQNMLGMFQGGGGGANANAAINPYFANTPGVGSITPV